MFLDSNVFEENEAQNKGGAMRYVNRNFTTVYQSARTGRRLESDKPHSEGPDLVDTNKYVNNKAVQSNEIASYVNHFEYVFEQNNSTFDSKLD